MFVRHIAGGEPAEDLHVTLVYFGEDVRGFAEAEFQQKLRDLVIRYRNPLGANVTTTTPSTTATTARNPCCRAWSRLLPAPGSVGITGLSPAGSPKPSYTDPKRGHITNSSATRAARVWQASPMIRRLAVIAVCLLLWAGAAPPVSASGDVAQAKATGGIIALFPRDAEAQMLVVPGGAAAAQLHLTLVDFGQDVRGWPQDELLRRLGDLAAAHPNPVQASVFGHGVLNPNGRPASAATIYIVGDSPDLTTLREQALTLSAQLVPLPAQHDPWIAHITAAYGSPEAVLSYFGPVVFDRIGVIWAGDATYFPLT